VSEIDGKYSARAALTRAFAAISDSSAETTSGRCVSSSDGSPAGTTGVPSSSSGWPRVTGPGLRPTSTESAFSWRAMRCLSAGIAAAATSYCERACDNSTLEITPPL
jgi:hypothetical protein